MKRDNFIRTFVKTLHARVDLLPRRELRNIIQHRAALSEGCTLLEALDKVDGTQIEILFFP